MKFVELNDVAGGATTSLLEAAELVVGIQPAPPATPASSATSH
jgi:hypothetical protein